MDHHPRNRLPRLALGALLLVLAICISLWLSFSSWQQSRLPGCGLACSEVLSSPWASVFGFPIAFLGLLAYLSLALACFLKRTFQFLFSGSLILLGALYFTAVQAFVIKAWCPWCCLAHAAATSAVLLLGFRLPRLSVRPLILSATAATFAIVALATTQTLFPHRGKSLVAEISPTSSAPDPDLIRLHGGAITLRESDYFVLTPNSPGAENRLLFISDYDCGTCIRLKLAFKDWIKRPDCPARVILIPVARSENARSLMRYLHAARLHDRALFQEIDQLLNTRELPSADLAVKHRLEEKLGGPEKLAAIMEQYGPKADELLAAADALFQYNATIEPQLKNIVPQALVGNRILSAQIPTDADIIAALSQSGLPISAQQVGPPRSSDSPAMAPLVGAIQPIYATTDLGEAAPGNRFYTSLDITNSGTEVASLTGLHLPPGVKVTSPLPLQVLPDHRSVLGLEITAPSTPGSFELPIIFQEEPKIASTITGIVLAQ